MKKSKIVSLVLISAYLASCQKEEPKGTIGADGKKVYMRSDSTANYSQSHCHSGGGNAWLWYYAFRPYGFYNGNTGSYQRTGFYSSGISEHSNIGTSTHKSHAVRGGFGSGHFSVSS
jgi:hypothetical protein